MFEPDARWGDFILKNRSNHHDTAQVAEMTPSLASGTFVLLVRLFFSF